ncbi:hypothetical protein ABGB18_33275 [Nonomuraea sp. B12E4]|uniref:hypothetical protein n=1 Tax=Nonomuraea sp. B12E4 TaxID=3153564 RepID=UPI00325E33E7
MLIQPGIIRTEFEEDTSRELRAVSGRGPYGRLAEAMAKRAENATRASEPAVVAKTITRLLESPRPKPRYPVGYLARTILAMNRLLPDRRFDAMVTKID